jgi:hypothetical protein
MIRSALRALDDFCEKEDYKGWDPYDGLNSRLFKATSLNRHPFFRLAWIQLFKRSPANFRRICLIPKAPNAKGLALFTSAYLSRGETEKAGGLFALMKKLAAPGAQRAGWGYNFDWQARAFYVPEGTPNMVVTVFVAHAFLDFYDATRNKEAMEFAIAAGSFILENLILFEESEALCFAYVHGESARVHNANMLGAAILARLYSYTTDPVFYEKSKKAMRYSVNALTPEGAWPYGELPHHRFIDNFHTGYNLTALKKWMEYTGDFTWEKQLKKAYPYYLDTFWLENGCPRYYHNSLYPIDIHCSAQGIITCLELAEYDEQSLPLARQIARWAIRNMQDKSGYFYYQKTRWYTNRIPYMRWSQAWMFYALARFAVSCQTNSSA